MLDLYPYQENDIKKLYRQKSASIESEMGSGKTLEAIALEELWNPLGEKPTLVIAPINTFDTWRSKYAIQAPGVDLITIDRKNAETRNEFLKKIQKRQGDVFLMHYEAVPLMPKLQKIEFEVIICDEAHRLSNWRIKRTQAVKRLKTNHKLAMSGTMTGEYPDRLWSIYEWLWPEYFTSYWSFRKRFCEEEEVWSEKRQTYYTTVVGTKNIDILNDIRDPWRVRHLKREQCCSNHLNGIMNWLPDKTYDDPIMVDLSPTQRNFYDQMEASMIAWIGENQNEPLVAQVVIAQLTRLNQMALATPEFYTKLVWTPYYEREHDQNGKRISEPETPIINPITGLVEKHRVPIQAIKLKAPSSKIEACIDFIKDHASQPLVVFSSSKKVCYLAQEEFAKQHITSEVLSGDTPQSQRDGMVKRFNNGDFQVFIGVIEAAAEGIDELQLTCDTMIFLDRSWRTIKNKQAEERLDRPGQKNTTRVIDIQARGTRDAGRKQQLEFKWENIRSMLGDPTLGDK